MRCAFRVDSGYGLGVGHIKRCIALATALEELGAKILFVCRAHDGHATHFLDSSRFDLTLLPAGKTVVNGQNQSFLGVSWKTDAFETCDALKDWSNNINWLIVDHYAIDRRWHNTVRYHTDSLAVIDDNADRHYNCDILINPVGGVTEYQKKTPQNCIMLLGLEYVLLHPSYFTSHRKMAVKNSGVKRILLFFGGSDSSNMTLAFLSLMARIISKRQLESLVRLDVVTTSANKNNNAIKSATEKLQFTRYHNNLPSLVPILEQTDLAIGSLGIAAFERVCLGVFSFVVTTSKNQLAQGSLLHNKKAVELLGDSETLDWIFVEEKITSYLQFSSKQVKNKLAQNLVDGAGARRVANTFCEISDEMITSPLCPNDEALIRSMANDPSVRAQSFDSKNISIERHASVFSYWLDAVDTVRIYVMRNKDGEPIGQTRFELKEDYWFIDYSLVGKFRGKGMAKRLLRSGIQRLWYDYPEALLMAEVKKTNAISKRVFKSLRFQPAGKTADVVRFSLRPTIPTRSMTCQN